MWMFQGDPCAPGLRKEIYLLNYLSPLEHLNILIFLGVNQQDREAWPGNGCAWVNVLLIHTLHIIIHVLINLSVCRRCTDCANLRQSPWIFLLADGKGTNSYEPQKIHRGHIEKPKEGEN